MQISSFNGGLNKRLSPFLLQSNEGVKYSNIDTTSGALAPLKENKDLNAKIKPSFTYFNGHWVNSDENRDYVKFQDKIFYSNGITRPQWSEDGFTWYGLGIDKPVDSLDVTLLNSQGLKLKALYGYYEEGDGNNCDYFTKDQNPYLDGFCGSRTLLNFESGSVSGYYCLGEHKQIEFIKNVKSKIFEDGEQSKDNFYNGEATIYHKVENTSSSYVAVVCRETNDLRYPYPPDLVIRETPIHSKFANEPNWYVKTDADIAFKVKSVRRADSWEFGEDLVPTAGYISNEVGDYNSYPDIEVPLYVKPESEVVFIVKDKDGVITNILSDVVPKDFTPIHKPNVGGMVYFAGFSFEWIFQANESVDIFIDGSKIASRSHSDIVRNNRVFVESKCVDKNGTIQLQTILNKLRAIQYVITYSNGEYESQPSDSVSVPFLSGDTKSVLPVVSIKPSTDPQVNSIKLYRLGGGLTQFSLVKEFPNKAITFIDSVTNFELDGAVLNSYNNLPAPNGLQYMTLYNTMLFGSINDKLYYTDVANPFVWSGFNFIDFDDTITGIGATSNGLLVFTRHSTYIITGTSPDTFSKYLLSSGVGCILHKSIQSLQNTLLWLSEDSICASNGGSIQTLSRDKLNVLDLATPRCSAVLNDVYYLSYNSGTIIADFRFGLTFRESDKVYYGFAVNENSLYAVESGDKFVEVNKGNTNSTLTYLSPKFSDGSISMLKTYKDIYFYSSGDLNVKVFIDDTLAGEQQLAKGFTEIKVSSENTQGYNIQFEVTGTGTLNEIEYKVEGRQNGR